ncbi:isochorismatase family protein [Xylariaceae sp. FL0804]|nr:isochorismatase family protein [Xylariaceae sp. FL0804]
MDKTALLVLDVQPNIVSRVEGAGVDMDQYLTQVARTTAAARGVGLLVMQVTTGFRNLLIDASPRNRMSAAGRTGSLFHESDPESQPHPRAGPADDDVRVTKRRVSAFHATDLDLLLRSSGVGRLAVCGLATSGAVLSTVRQAADLDYQIAVLGDLCADRQADVHEFTVSRILSKQASVETSEQWIGQLETK